MEHLRRNDAIPRAKASQKATLFDAASASPPDEDGEGGGSLGATSSAAPTPVPVSWRVASLWGVPDAAIPLLPSNSCYNELR